jgi:hypothetical protein
MSGLELAGGYLAMWGVSKLVRAGKRHGQKTDEKMGAGLDELHDAVVGKLGTDAALVKLDADVAQGVEPSDRTLRRVQDAVEEAADDDHDFAADLEDLLARLEEARNSVPPVGGIDLRGSRGVQVGNYNTQTNTFN